MSIRGRMVPLDPLIGRMGNSKSFEKEESAPLDDVLDDAVEEW